MEKGKRKHPFKISVRPKGLCTAVLWEKVRILGIKMSMAEFFKRVGVSRSTIIGVNKQLGTSDISEAKPKPKVKVGSKPKPEPKVRPKTKSETQSKTLKQKLDKTR